MNSEKSNQLFKASIVLAAAIVFSVMIGARTLERVINKDQSIAVTGSARKRIKSDFIVWRATLSSQSPQLSAAYRELAENIPRVKAYLTEKGVPEELIVVSSISTEKVMEKSAEGTETNKIIAYSLSQTLEVRSPEVDKIARISRQITELIDQGILLESSAPEYHYTKLSDLKIEMLQEASKDAKLRAQQIAASADSSIGKMKEARMGVFQITPADSNEVSGYGINDTTSFEKDITAVVNISFALD